MKVSTKYIGAGAVASRTKSLRGAGLPDTQGVMIRRLAGRDAKNTIAKRLARLN